MGNCEYTLVKTCIPYMAINQSSVNFEILQENMNLDTNPRVSATKKITLLYDNYMFELLRGPELRVDGLRTSPPFNMDAIEVKFIPGYLMLVSDFGLKIRWDGEYNVEIYIQDVFSGLLCGLCGNLDYNTTNDFTTPEGAQ
ncbi:luciferin 2-monooxygenase-like, partial [Anneissia japonica]|uniref:luciferin 2-monooxygenase-like n=1 Tax=Anneissia japonica TaxID=1529436 RepID=UPI0014258B00